MTALEGPLTRRACALGSVLLLVLSGCASLHEKRARSDRELEGMEVKSGQVVEVPDGRAIANRYWRMGGKLGVRSRQGSANLQIYWTQAGDRYRILLTTPFGQSVAQIEGGDRGGLGPGSEFDKWVSLRVEGEEPVYAAGAEALTEATLGWRFPAANLPFWVRGEPAPGILFDAARASDGRLLLLRQSGWSIRYDRYESIPTRMRFEGEGVELRLVVKSWTPGPEID